MKSIKLLGIAVLLGCGTVKITTVAHAGGSFLTPIDWKNFQDVAEQAKNEEFHKPVTLETFLSVKYLKYSESEAKPSFKGDSFKQQVEIQHLHSLRVFDGNGRELGRGPKFVESVVEYVTAIDDTGKKVHLLVDMNPAQPLQPLQYLVVLVEGADTAKVWDPENLFDEAHLKEKINIYLDDLKAEKAGQTKS